MLFAQLLVWTMWKPARIPTLVSTILSFSGEVKAVAQHHKDMIRRLMPELLEYPFNSPDSRMNLTAIQLR